MINQELIDFKNRWIQSDEETLRKLEIVRNILTEINDDLFQNAINEFDLLKNLIQMAHFLAHLNPVNDELLSNFTRSIYLSACATTEAKREEFVQLAAPGFLLLYELINSEYFTNFLIESSIAGDEFFTVGSITIPISKEALKKYYKNSTHSIFSFNDVANLVVEFVKFKKNQFKEFSPTKNNNVESESVPEFVSDNLQAESKKLDLYEKLSKNNFFELNKTKHLDQVKKNELIELMLNHDLSYQIALLNYVGFIDYMNDNCDTNTGLFSKMSTILNRPLRAVAGNIRSFMPKSKDRAKYFAYKYLDLVESDFKKF